MSDPLTPFQEINSPNENSFEPSGHIESDGYTESYDSIDITGGRWVEPSGITTFAGVTDICDTTNRFVVADLDTGTIYAQAAAPASGDARKRLLVEVNYEEYTVDSGEYPDNPPYAGQYVIYMWRRRQYGDIYSLTGLNYHFECEASGIDIKVHGGRWTRSDGTTDTTVELSISNSGDLGPSYADYATLTNVQAISYTGYVIITLDDEYTPTTLIPSIVATYPVNDPTRKICVLAYYEVDFEGNVTTIEPYWTGGDIRDVLYPTTTLDTITSMQYNVSEHRLEIKTTNIKVIEKDSESAWTPVTNATAEPCD